MKEEPLSLGPGRFTRSCRIFSALNFFLILAIFILVFSDLIGLNLPKYYPLSQKWSILPLSGPAMGFFGAMGFTVFLALPISILFYLLLPLQEKFLEIRYKTFKNLSTGFLLFGIFYFIAKEWKAWGIDKMGAKSQDFFDARFWLFIFILASFIVLLKIILFLEKKIFD